MRELMVVVAIVLIFVAYVPYVRDIVKGKTKPHPYTWLISGSATLIAAGLQISDGAAFGAAPTFIAGGAGIIIFILALDHKSRPSITKLDGFFLLLALSAVVLGLVHGRRFCRLC